MFCKNCGQEIDENAAFCSHCGQKIENKPARCSNCGQELKEQDAYCSHCGQKVVDKSEFYNSKPTNKSEFYNGSAKCEFVNSTPQKSANGLGIAGFVVSLLSLYLGAYFCLASIVGLVLSVVGYSRRANYSLNGLAIAGTVISIISLVFWGNIWFMIGVCFTALL